MDGRTRKRLLNIDRLPRTRLHKAAAPPSRPLQSLPTADDPPLLQIALVPRDDLDGRYAPLVDALLALHVDHLHEVLERVERRRVGDVVD